MDPILGCDGVQRGGDETLRAELSEKLAILRSGRFRTKEAGNAETAPHNGTTQESRHRQPQGNAKG